MALIGLRRQAKIDDYFHTKVLHIYVPIMKRYKTRKGLSERQLKKRLEKQGWEVWRGGSLNAARQREVFPNVKRKYEKLYRLMKKHHPGKLDLLQLYCAVHHGVPDYLCYRHGRFKFVECKLGHEQLSKRQKRCIQKLQSFGFEVEVHKFVDHCTKTRRATVDLANGMKHIHEFQAKLARV